MSGKTEFALAQPSARSNFVVDHRLLDMALEVAPLEVAPQQIPRAELAGAKLTNAGRVLRFASGRGRVGASLVKRRNGGFAPSAPLRAPPPAQLLAPHLQSSAPLRHAYANATSRRKTNTRISARTKTLSAALRITPTGYRNTTSMSNRMNSIAIM